MGIEKEIYSGIYGGFKKTDVKDLVTVACARSEECSLYKAGKCACLPVLFAPDCPFGKRSRTHGYSERAAKYYDWEKGISHRDSYRKLSKAIKYVARVGDVLMSDMYCGIIWEEKENRWKGPMMFSPTHPTILPVSQITPEMLLSLYQYKPFTVFDHQPMKGWDKDRDDWFTKLNEVFPELVQAFKDRYLDIDLSFTHVGRYAYLKTLVDGSVIQDDSKLKWTFDKKRMVIYNDKFRPEYRSIFRDKNVTTKIESPVTDQMICKVLSDDWVDQDTVYVN